VFSWSHAERLRVMDFKFLSWLIPVKFLAIGQAPRSQVCAWPYPLVFLCPLSSSATLTWSSWSLCPASEDFYGSDTSLCNHWPCTLEPSVSFVLIHFINWWAKCLFSFSRDCSLCLLQWKRFWLVCTARSAI